MSFREEKIQKEEIFREGIFFFCPRANLPAAGRFARIVLAGSLFSLLTTIDHRQTLDD